MLTIRLCLETGGPMDDILKIALDQFKESEERTSYWRDEAKDDHRFSEGEQWDERIKQYRIEQGLPCLTVDRLEGPVSQMVGDQRQNDISIRVIPKKKNDLQDINGKSMDESAVLDGMIREIQRQSRFEAIQSYAFELAIKTGLSGWYLETEYASPESFDQNIAIRRIISPFSIYPDVSGWWDKKQTYCHILDSYTKDEFKKKWPKATVESFSGGNDGWFGDEIRVSQYHSLDYVSDILQHLELENGEFLTALESSIDPERVIGAKVLRERRVKVPKVTRRLMTANEVLEESIWPGETIPVVLLMGQESWVDGKLDWKGMIRKAKDPQRMYNYYISAKAEMLGAAPKAPYMATPEQIRGYEGMWARANSSKLTYLLVNPDPKAPGWPQRQQVQYPAGFSQEAMVMAEDIKAVTKVFDAGLGARSNETSGKAIAMRQRESDVGNYIFSDNLKFAVEMTGRIIVEAIPKVYDATREVTSRNQRGEINKFMLNKPIPGGMMNTLSGEYDIEITAGPSYTTQRQESVEAMTELLRAAPNMMQMGADIWIGNMDWDGADELAKRLRKMVPPQLLDEDQEKADPQVQLQQMQQAVQQLQQALQQAQMQLQQMAQQGQASEQEKVKQEMKIEQMTAQLEKANALLDITKQAADVQVSQAKAALELKDQFIEAQQVLREGMQQPEVNLDPIQKQLEMLAQLLAQPKESQPIQVIVESERPKTKVGKAKKQPDGSWMLESQEIEQPEDKEE